MVLAILASVSSVLATPQVKDGGESVYDHYYNEIVRADLAADRAWTALKSPDAVVARQRELRAKWLEAIGGLPERTPLNVRTVGVVRKDGYRIEKLLFESRPRHCVSAHLFLPDSPAFKAPYPGIISPCGHSRSGKLAPWYQRPGVIAAKAGFAYLVYDPIDQGERYQAGIVTNGLWSSTREHNRLGMRAALLGWNTVQFRLWDGMRAVDVLESRADVKGPKYGVMGISGGGTMSSYIMAFEDRIGAAAPAGFLSTMRTVCDHCGPQDAEQNVFGQLAFGFNHLGYVLARAPSPVMMNCTHADFFPFGGSIETYSAARGVYKMLGAGESVDLFDVPGPHHWFESEQSASVKWMKRHLCGETEAYGALEADRLLDVGFDYAKVDCGTADLKDPQGHATAEGKVTPSGYVMDLPGARSTYDVVRDELRRAQKTRKGAVTPDDVRRIVGMRASADCTATAADEVETVEKGVRMLRATLVNRDNLRIPTVMFLPTETKGTPVLLVSDKPERRMLAGRVESLLAAGRAVMVAELRAFGETGRLRAGQPHGFYGSRDEDEEVAMMCFWLGRSLVGARAEDLYAAAKHFAKILGGGKVLILAEGRAAVPAAHAYFCAKEFFAGIELVDPPASWSAVIADHAIDYRFANVVHNALRHYDWTDLAR